MSRKERTLCFRKEVTYFISKRCATFGRLGAVDGGYVQYTRGGRLSHPSPPEVTRLPNPPATSIPVTAPSCAVHASTTGSHSPAPSRPLPLSTSCASRCCCCENDPSPSTRPLASRIVCTASRFSEAVPDAAPPELGSRDFQPDSSFLVPVREEKGRGVK